LGLDFGVSSVKETLGDRIARAKKERGLRNGILAHAAGVHINTVSKWISGAQTPDAAALDAIAKELMVSTSWLLHGDETVAGGNGSRSNQASRLSRTKLPPRAYERVYNYLEKMRAADLPADMIEESERLMVDPLYSKINKRDIRERSEEDLITDIDASWSWIREVVEREWGKRLK
jgi:transcriptional regulator with XRE-family HTH domain